MKRPILIITIGFIIGILLGLYFKIGIAFIFAIFLSKKVKKSVVILLILSSLASYAYISFCENDYICKYADISNVKGKAVVISNIEGKQYYNTCIIRYENTNLILRTKEVVNYGDLIEVSGEFKLPSSQRNYGGFDYREYLKTKKVYGIVTAKKVVISQENYLSRIEMFSNFVREKISEIIKTIDNSDTGGLLIGILLGNKDEISDEIQTDFKNSGLSHLLAVSGLHVNYVILAIIYFLSKTNINKRLASFFTILFLIFFMYITNFTESVVRAGIMGIISLGATILYRKTDIATSISLSLLITLVENPYKIFSIGLQLSYAGTLGIVLFYPKLKHKFNDVIAVCLSAQILIFPIILLHFNMFSTHFILANILASPLAGIIIIYGFVFVFVSFISIKLGAFIYLPLKIILKVLILINYVISNLPFSTIIVKTPYWFNIVWFYICAIKPKKVFFIVMIVLLIFTIYLDINNDFSVYFVDVGQGDCTVIRSNTNKVILIDGGGNENYDVGKNVLVPYLLDRRINKIDYMIMSHLDSDHCLGLFEVIKQLSVRNIIIPIQFENSLNYEILKKLSGKSNLIYVKAGDCIGVDKDTRVNILWPVQDYIKDNAMNNNSIVAKIVHKNTSMLFTGDIEEKAEIRIADLYGESLKSDILKVAHHGSKTSSTEKFISMVKPRIALIGVGENNTFGHPNAEVISRFEKMRYTNL